MQNSRSNRLIPSWSILSTPLPSAAILIDRTLGIPQFGAGLGLGGLTWGTRDQMSCLMMIEHGWLPVGKALTRETIRWKRGMIHCCSQFLGADRLTDDGSSACQYAHVAAKDERCTAIKAQGWDTHACICINKYIHKYIHICIHTDLYGKDNPRGHEQVTLLMLLTGYGSVTARAGLTPQESEASATPCPSLVDGFNMFQPSSKIRRRNCIVILGMVDNQDDLKTPTSCSLSGSIVAHLLIIYWYQGLSVLCNWFT